MKDIFFNKKVIANIIISLHLLLVAMHAPMAFAQSADASQKAMKYAEKRTNGKAIKTQYFANAKKKGYKVRVLKDGKVSHVFIRLSELK